MRTTSTSSDAWLLPVLVIVVGWLGACLLFLCAFHRVMEAAPTHSPIPFFLVTPSPSPSCFLAAVAVLLCSPSVACRLHASRLKAGHVGLAGGFGDRGSSSSGT